MVEGSTTYTTGITTPSTTWSTVLTLPPFRPFTTTAVVYSTTSQSGTTQGTHLDRTGIARTHTESTTWSGSVTFTQTLTHSGAGQTQSITNPSGHTTVTMSKSWRYTMPCTPVASSGGFNAAHVRADRHQPIPESMGLERGVSTRPDDRDDLGLGV